MDRMQHQYESEEQDTEDEQQHDEDVHTPQQERSPRPTAAAAASSTQQQHRQSDRRGASEDDEEDEEEANPLSSSFSYKFTEDTYTVVQTRTGPAQAIAAALAAEAAFKARGGAGGVSSAARASSKGRTSPSGARTAPHHQDQFDLRHELDSGDEDEDDETPRGHQAAEDDDDGEEHEHDGAGAPYSTPLSPAIAARSHQGAARTSGGSIDATLSAPSSPLQSTVLREPSFTIESGEDGFLHSRQPSMAFPNLPLSQPQQPQQPSKHSRDPSTSSNRSAGAPKPSAVPLSPAAEEKPRRALRSDSTSSRGSSLHEHEHDLPSPSPDDVEAALARFAAQPPRGAAAGASALPAHDYSLKQSYTDQYAFGSSSLNTRPSAASANSSRSSSMSLRQASTQIAETEESEEETKRQNQRKVLDAIAAQREANRRALAAASRDVDRPDDDDDDDHEERSFEITDGGRAGGGDGGALSSSNPFDTLTTRDLAATGRTDSTPSRQPGASSVYRGRQHETNTSLALSEASPTPSPRCSGGGGGGGGGATLSLIQASLAATGTGGGGLGHSWQRVGATGGALASSSSGSSGSLVPTTTFPATLNSSDSAALLAYSSLSRSQDLQEALSSHAISVERAERLVQLLIDKENEIYEKSRAMREAAFTNAQRNEHMARLIWDLERAKAEYNRMLADVRALSAGSSDSVNPQLRIEGTPSRHRRGKLSQEYIPSKSVDLGRGGPEAILPEEINEYIEGVRAAKDSARSSGEGIGGGSTSDTVQRSRRNDGTASGDSLEATPLPSQAVPQPSSQTRTPLKSQSATSTGGRNSPLSPSSGPESSGQDTRGTSGAPSQIHSARGHPSSSTPSFVPPLNIPVVSLPVSAPPTSRDGAPEEESGKSARKTGTNAASEAKGPAATTGAESNASPEAQAIWAEFDAEESSGEDDASVHKSVVEHEHASQPADSPMSITEEFIASHHRTASASAGTDSSADPLNRRASEHPSEYRHEHLPPPTITAEERRAREERVAEAASQEAAREQDAQRRAHARSPSMMPPQSPAKKPPHQRVSSAQPESLMKQSQQSSTSSEDAARDAERKAILQQWAEEDRRRAAAASAETGAAQPKAEHQRTPSSVTREQQQAKQGGATPAGSARHTGSISRLSEDEEEKRLGQRPAAEFVALMSTDVATLQAELLHSRQDAERMRGLVLRLKSDRVKLKQKVEALKLKLAQARGTATGDASAAQRHRSSSRDRFPSSSSAADRSDSPSSSFASSVASSSAEMAVGPASKRSGVSSSSLGVIQKLAQDQRDLKRRFKQDSKAWKEQREAMEAEIRRLNAKIPEMSASSSSPAAPTPSSQPVSAPGLSGADLAAFEEWHRRNYPHDSRGAAMGVDELAEEQKQFDPSSSQRRSQQQQASVRGRDPIIHILPNSSLDEGLGAGAPAASFGGGSRRTSRSPDYLASLSPAHAHAHVYAEQQASSIQAHGRGRSRSTGPTARSSHSQYAGVGPRISREQLNPQILEPSEGIDERAEEEHRKREEERQQRIRDKIEAQRQEEQYHLQQEREQEQRKQAAMDRERQRVLQSRFERYQQLQRMQQQQQEAALEASCNEAAAQPQSFSASSAEGFDRRRAAASAAGAGNSVHRRPLAPPPMGAAAGWNLEREVAWQVDRAQVAARDKHPTEEKRAYGIPFVPSRSQGGQQEGRRSSPSPSRSQHRFIREEVREQERQKLFQHRYGEQ